MTAGDAFVTLSHFCAMTGEWRAGLEVYRKHIAHARSLGNVQFTTVSEWADAAPRGAVQPS